MAADHRRVGVVCLADIVAQRAQRDGRFRQLAHARGLDDEASTADVKALVREYCEASGLDWSSLQGEGKTKKTRLPTGRLDLFVHQ